MTMWRNMGRKTNENAQMWQREEDLINIAQYKTIHSGEENVVFSHLGRKLFIVRI